MGGMVFGMLAFPMGYDGLISSFKIMCNFCAIMVCSMYLCCAFLSEWEESHLLDDSDFLLLTSSWLAH